MKHTASESSQSGKAQNLPSETGWRRESTTPSLPEVYASISVARDGVWRKLWAFSGPGLMVAVGYMDPGNWATDLAGAQFGYALLSVVLISNFMAIVLQHLALKLGIVSGRDLAQACRDHFSRPVGMLLWVLCETAIAACDLAEVIGSAIALNLLFHIPIVYGVILTALDVVIVLYLQNKGFRYIEALVASLIALIGLCFLYEIIVSGPAPGPLFAGFVPSAEIIRNPQMLYVAVGILGATRDATQSVSAFEYRPDASFRAQRYRQTNGDSVCDDRFHCRAAVRFLHQRGNPDRGRRDFLWH